MASPGKMDWYDPAQGKVVEVDDPDYHASPYEAAHASGQGDAFDQAVATYYGNDGGSPVNAADHPNTNFYQPETYNWLVNPSPASTTTATPTPTPNPTPTPAPTPPSGPGGGGPTSNAGGGDLRSSYRPPAFTPSPFITPNGQIPPGLPFSPDPHAVALQNAALEKALNNPAVEPFQNPFKAKQDELVNSFLNTPMFDNNYVNMLNEQQKEIALAREQAANRGVMQRSANRGVLGGGQVDAGVRRNRQDTTAGLLQSHRDISTKVQGDNRVGYERAVSLADQIAAADADKKFREQTANRQALLDALGTSELVYGGREDRGLNVAKLMETIREYDMDIANRQAEFSAGSTFGYDNMNTNNRFNYDSLNSNNERAWLDYLARLAGR